MRLGYSAYSPLPEAFFEDPKAFEKKPVGAGQFKVDSIKTTPRSCSQSSPTSPAPSKANVDKLTFRVYQDPAAAYADAVAGSLDYIDDSNIPSDQLIGEAYKSDFPDRTARSASSSSSWLDLVLLHTTRSYKDKARAAQGILDARSIAS